MVGAHSSPCTACIHIYIHTSHGADEPLKLFLVLSQLNEQESPQSNVEHRTTTKVKVAVRHTQEGKVLRL